jgi:hypothetical protein
MRSARPRASAGSWLRGLALATSCLGSLACRPKPTEPSKAQEKGPGPGTSINVIDLSERARALSQEMRGQRDAYEPYFSSRNASAGMHVIGPRHACALHIHRASHETTAIVTGSPEVSFAFARRDRVAARAGTYLPGTLVSSPPHCGHRWVNPSATATQANLVLSSPPFDGNQFVGPDDEQLRGGGEPRIYDPDAMLAALGPAVPFAGEKLPVLNGKLSSLLIRGETTLAPSGSARLLYTARGKATAHADREVQLRKHHLVLIPKGASVRLRAEQPTVMFLLDPDDGVSTSP